MITVLLSAYNEAPNPYLWKTIDLVRNLSSLGLKIEVIVGITIGADDTLERLKNNSVKFIEINTTKRADRYNAALELSSASGKDWIVLNHPRSILQANALLSLESQHESINWGAFTHEFDLEHPLLNFTSWWSNSVRGDIKKIFYLDHCIFVRRNLLEKIKGVPSVEIFEDTLLSKQLSDYAHPVRLPWKSTTSAIRFTKNGVWRQAIKNQILKIQFSSGASDKGMNKEYENGLFLNG